MKRHIKLISILAAGLVLLLAAGAFSLSYSALVDVASKNGWGNGWQAYVWPLLLDTAMLIFSLAVLRANLRRESAVYPWILTGGFAVLATIANVVDVTTLGIPDTVIKATVKALAPVALALSFHLLMEMVKAEIKRAAVSESISALNRQADHARAVLDDLDGNRQELESAIAALNGKAESLKEELAAMRKEKRNQFAGINDDTRQQAMAILAERSAISGADLGRELGKSERLGRKLKKELLPVVLASGNGTGQGVTE